MSEKTFFRGRRLSVYCKGGRLMIDKKTDIRFWRLKLALTMMPADARACGGAIQSNYEQIQVRENAVEKIELGGCVNHVVTFFEACSDDAAEVLRLDDCLLDRFAMTYADGVTEFWLHLEAVNTDVLHRFVKDYAFTRFAVEFLPKQRTLDEAIEDSAKDPNNPLQKLADKDGVSMTLTNGEGKKLAEFKPKGRVQ